MSPVVKETATEVLISIERQSAALRFGQFFEVSFGVGNVSKNKFMFLASVLGTVDKIGVTILGVRCGAFSFFYVLSVDIVSDKICADS